VGGEILDFCEDGQCRAVVDSGTSVLAVPAAVAPTLHDTLERSLHSPLPEASASLDCRLAQGAVLSFDIEGMTITLGPGDYSREAVHGQTEVGGNTTMSAPHCRPTLLPFHVEAPLGPKLFIWGEPVLESITRLTIGKRNESALRSPRILRGGRRDSYEPGLIDCTSLTISIMEWRGLHSLGSLEFIIHSRMPHVRVKSLFHLSCGPQWPELYYISNHVQKRCSEPLRAGLVFIPAYLYRVRP